MEITKDGTKAIDNPILLIFSCNGRVVTFRLIKDFMNFLEKLQDILKYSYYKSGGRRKTYQSNHQKKPRSAIIWVHNLKYDIYALLDPLKEHFEIDPHETMIIKSKIVRLKAGQFIFRDSLVLTGLSLEKSGIEFDIPEEFRKKTGDWDYNRRRTTNSKITDEEMGYAINDVLALEQIIRAVMNLHNVKRQQDLPPTKTGFVRRTIKRGVRKDAEYQARIDFKRTSETDRLSKRCYHGGISDINRHDAHHYGEGHIGDYDMTSQYPFVLCTQKYPLGDSKRKLVITFDGLDDIINSGRGFMADIMIQNIKIKNDMISPILTDEWPRLYHQDERNIFYNSRIYESHTEFSYSCTSVEWQEIRQYFDITGYVTYCEVFNLGRLPAVFINLILDAYANKTIYKGDDSNITKYKLAKIVVNSIYGICGTNPNYEDKTLDLSTWEIRPLTTAEINWKLKHRKPGARFVDYRWAPYCTSYARHYLGRALCEVGDDAIYCDTDSVKFRDGGYKYDVWFEAENQAIIETLKQAGRDLGISYNRFAPKDRFGRPHPLGVWDDDSFDGAIYAKAPKDNTKLKRQEDDSFKLAITSSGINAKHLMDYYTRGQQLETPLEIFNFYKKNAPIVTIPAEYSGKLTHKLVFSGPFYGKYYYGDDGTTGPVQCKMAESLFPAPYQKIEKNERNQLDRGLIETMARIMEAGEFVDDLEAETER